MLGAAAAAACAAASTLSMSYNTAADPDTLRSLLPLGKKIEVKNQLIL